MQESRFFPSSQGLPMTALTLGSIVRQGALVLALAGVAAASTAQTATSPSYWSPSWISATQPLWDGNFVLPSGVPFQFQRQTVRQIARLSIGGARLRVVISNEGGTSPLHIGAARMAQHGEG